MWVKKDFFDENLCIKLNLLYFQLDHLILHHYPSLWVRWKNHALSSQLLFSAFVVSLFTAFSTENSFFLFEFWDVILTEKWIGVIKCVLFVIDVCREELVVLDYQATLAFFNDIKENDVLIEKISGVCFKDFIERFVFDEELLCELEYQYKEIKESNIIF